MHDDTQVSRIYVMAKALHDGLFPVRFVSDLGYGYGYAIFNFYAPLPYYIGGFLTLITGNALLATKAFFLLILIGSGISMFYALRQFFTTFPSLAAAIFYVYFPYHAVNTYVRGNLSELSAYVLLPLVFAALFRLYYASERSIQSRFKDIVVFILSFSGIVLSHNLSAYMTGLFMALFVSVSLFTVKMKKSFVYSILLGTLLTCLLTAFYWIPVVFESQFTDVASQIGGGSDFRDHFVCLEQFWVTNWGYTGSLPGCSDGMSFTLGKLTILLLPLLLIALLYAYHKKMLPNIYLTVVSLIGLCIAFFFMILISEPFWKIVPGMSYLQFPWRFMNYVAVFYAFVVASVLYAYQQKMPRAVLIGTMIFIGVTVLYNSRLFVPQQMFERDVQFYTNRDYIGYEVSKKSDEYLPSNFRIITSASDIPSETITGENIVIREVSNKTGRYEGYVSASSSGTLHANIAYFPAWKAYINGKETTITPTRDGFTVVYPKGESHLLIIFKQTGVEMIGNIFSLLGLIIIIGIIAKGIYGKGKTS